MSKPSKNQRREDARAQAMRLREQQQREARRQRTIVITLLVVGLLVVGGVVAWILSNQPEPPPDFSEVDEPLAEVTTPQAANDEGGIPVGPRGVAGSTEEAGAEAVDVVVYADYLCPVCGTFEEINGAVLAEMREAGEVVVEYRPVSILDAQSAGTQYSTRAAAAAAFVADRSPEAFVDFNDLMFANQPSEGSAALSDEEIAEVARAAGVSDEAAGAIEDGSYMVDEDSFAPWVAAATEQATRDFERFGTPTILVDGQDLRDLEVDWRVPGALESVVQEARG